MQNRIVKSSQNTGNYYKTFRFVANFPRRAISNWCMILFYTFGEENFPLWMRRDARDAPVQVSRGGFYPRRKQPFSFGFSAALSEFCRTPFFRSPHIYSIRAREFRYGVRLNLIPAFHKIRRPNRRARKKMEENGTKRKKEKVTRVYRRGRVIPKEKTPPR